MPASEPTAELIHINPADIVVGENVRLDARLDRDFIASIRERGVLVPVVGYRDDAGAFKVLYGQRRTLAAVQAKRPTIPAYVVDSQDEADRLIDQVVENEHRAPLTAGEKAKAFEQLAAIGLTAGQIAKRAGTKKTDVETALAVAASPMASKVAQRYDFLTLDQAATIADFDDDAEAVKALTVAASEGQFEHVAQRLRDDREREQVRASAAEELTAKGVQVVDRPAYDDKKIKHLYSLSAKEGNSRELTEKTHAKCPGNAAYITVNSRWGRDEQGNETREWVATTTFVCADWKKNGHVDRYASITSALKPAADMTEEEREAAKAERREVVENNKAWDAAEVVRREWVKSILTFKTPLPGSAALIAHGITGDWATSASVTDQKASEMAKALGVGVTTQEIEKATEGRATVLALGRVLAGYEAQLDRQSWRSVIARNAIYLKFLASHGYELSDVEKRAAGIEMISAARDVA